MCRKTTERYLGTKILTGNDENHAEVDLYVDLSSYLGNGTGRVSKHAGGRQAGSSSRSLHHVCMHSTALIEVDGYHPDEVRNEASLIAKNLEAGRFFFMHFIFFAVLLRTGKI